MQYPIDSLEAGLLTSFSTWLQITTRPTTKRAIRFLFTRRRVRTEPTPATLSSFHARIAGLLFKPMFVLLFIILLAARSIRSFLSRCQIGFFTLLAPLCIYHMSNFCPRPLYSCPYFQSIQITVETGSVVDDSLLKLGLIIFHKLNNLAVVRVHLVLATEPSIIQQSALTILGSTSDHIASLISDFTGVAASAQATVNLDHTTVSSVTAILKSKLASTTRAIDAATLVSQQAMSNLLTHVTPATVAQVHLGVAGVQSAGKEALAAIYSPTNSRIVKRFDVAGLLKSVAGTWCSFASDHEHMS